MVADELRRQADEFIDIASFAPAISRKSLARLPGGDRLPKDSTVSHREK